jgi:ribosomal-protein-alanine N-acetyltransferase
MAMPSAFCEGEEVHLRPVEPGDAAVVAQWKTDPFVRRMALDPGVATSTAGEAEEILRALGSPDELYLIVVASKTARPIGYARITWIDRLRRIGWLRFALGAQRGQGHAKDALMPLLRRLFADGAHRVEAEAYEFNEACLHLLEGLGFQREGVKRQAHFDGDRYCHVVVLGLLAEEFQE